MDTWFWLAVQPHILVLLIFVSFLTIHKSVAIGFMDQLHNYISIYEKIKTGNTLETPY